MSMQTGLNRIARVLGVAVADLPVEGGGDVGKPVGHGLLLRHPSPPVRRRTWMPRLSVVCGDGPWAASLWVLA